MSSFLNPRHRELAVTITNRLWSGVPFFSPVEMCLVSWTETWSQCTSNVHGFLAFLNHISLTVEIIRLIQCTFNKNFLVIGNDDFSLWSKERTRTTFCSPFQPYCSMVPQCPFWGDHRDSPTLKLRIFRRNLWQA